MSGALEEFQAQREAVEDIRNRVDDLAGLLQAIKADTIALARDGGLLSLLREEQSWLARAEEIVKQTRYLRELELSRIKQSVWRRWIIAITFGVAAAFACSAGDTWASRPWEGELTSLRARVKFLDFVEQRVMRMTAPERQEFDRLMRSNDSRKR